MMKKIFTLLSAALILAGCSDWLEVKPRTQVRGDQMYDSYKGFRDALTACYVKMNDRAAYGENLTMSAVESMAQLWEVTESSHPANYYLSRFEYDNEYARTTVKNTYAGLYNTIVQANSVLKGIGESGSVIADPAARTVVEGEALAIRAFCHLDVLRLFGQLPSGGTTKVSLPYCEQVSKEAVPYYAYEAFIAKIEADLSRAEALLKDNDPLFRYSFAQLDDPSVKAPDLEDAFLTYRRFRFNYYAVKALQARFYLYTGKPDKAYAAAKAVIGAKDPAGSPMVSLAGDADYTAGGTALPSECLLALSNYKMQDYVVDLLGGVNGVRLTASHLTLTETKLTGLFAGYTVSNRYTYVWNKTTVDSGGKTLPTCRKYYRDEQSAYNELFQVIPLLRLSEVYLVAIETATDLGEANALYTTYMQAHNILVSMPFASKEALMAELLGEYRREFYAEGQMFYLYKRLGAAAMLWGARAVGEADYIVPLPATEYNLNK